MRSCSPRPSPEQRRIWRERKIARHSFMERHKLSDPREPAIFGLWSPTARFWARALGLRSRDRQTWERCNALTHELPRDHVEVFARGRRDVVLTSQPYPSEDALAVDEATWRAVADRLGLRFERSDADSWHHPGRTALFMLWLDEPRLAARELPHAG